MIIPKGCERLIRLLLEHGQVQPGTKLNSKRQDILGRQADLADIQDLATVEPAVCRNFQAMPGDEFKDISGCDFKKY